MKKELITRNKENLFQLYREIARAGNCTLQMSQGFNWVDCRSSNWPLTIFDSDVEKADFPVIIDGIKKGILPAFWILLREADLLDTNIRFASNGFKHLAAWPAMCLDLSTLTDLGKSCEARIQRVEQEEDMIAWVALANATLFKTRTIEESLFKSLYHNAPEIRFYLAKVDTQVVSIVMSFLNKNTVGIYAVSTLEAYRNQGISSALTHYALSEAKVDGCDLASLQATEMGERVYRKLGFEVFGTFDVYWLLGYL